MTRNASVVARTVVELIDFPVPMDSAIAVFSRAGESAILESSRPVDTYGRFSILAADPMEVVEWEGGECCDPLARLAAAMSKYAVRPDWTGEIPFVGGWIGFLSYEAGLAPYGIRAHASARVATPLARLGLYDGAAVYDHHRDQWFVTAIDWPACSAVHRPPVLQRLNVLRERLREAARLDLVPPPSPRTTRPLPNMSRRAYMAKLLRIQKYIQDGDVYQVNLTQRFTARTSASPIELYRRVRAASPSSHAALLMWGRTAVVSSSPELFLRLRDGHVVTRPIKGTRPKTGDGKIDAIARRELEMSEKERAELTMIVDLLRNDLGRVCSFGTVRVTGSGEIEEHPTVFHRVATIEGDLRSGMGWTDLLRAAFPGGSVTGAPKRRAMQIIRELEPTPRGAYCGSIGWIGLDGAMSLNLAIRTMVQRGDAVQFHAGGGIVAESTPEAEYDEIVSKLRGMLGALNTEAPYETTRPVNEAAPTK